MFNDIVWVKKFVAMNRGKFSARDYDKLIKMFDGRQEAESLVAEYN